MKSYTRNVIWNDKQFSIRYAKYNCMIGVTGWHFVKIWKEKLILMITGLDNENMIVIFKCKSNQESYSTM